MPDTCTVSVDDVKIVTAMVNTAFGFLSHVPAAADFLAASARLAAAAEGQSMPECPVSSAEQMAIADRVMADAYTAHGFSDAEAFEVVRMNVAARLDVAARRMFAG